MGGGNPIKKIVEKVKTSVKKVGEGEFARKWINPAESFIAKQGSKFTGIDQNLLSISGGANKAIAKKFIEEPRRAKEDAALLAEETGKAQAAQLKSIKDRQVQEGAESDAANDLLKKRRKQASRKGSTGKGSTLLSDSLGSAGGEDNVGKGTLLGR